MTFDAKAYRREWARRKRYRLHMQARAIRLEREGKCLVCEMLLISAYHTNCPGAINIHETLDNMPATNKL